MNYALSVGIRVTALTGGLLVYAQASWAGNVVGDSRDDLVVGAPGEAPGSDPRSGVAFVYRGANQAVIPEMVLDQTGLGANEAGDQFGSAFAFGDFDGDGLTDLAVGAPGEAPGSDPASGVVFLFRGTSGSLIPDRYIDQATLGANEAGDRFGAALAAGDFNGDGFDDLVVGAPGEAPGSDPRSGGAFLFLGSPNGLRPHLFIDQRGLGSNEAGDRFGESLCVGDFDGDGRDDLAIGAPGEAPGSDPRSGVVFLFRGVPAGIARDRVLDQAGLGANEAGDLFGAALTSGDFNGDGRDDLAVGAPGEAPGSDPRSGGVFVYRGTHAGLVASQFVDQAGLGANEAGDEFGFALSSGDYNGDGLDDLAVGAPGEAPGSDPRSGGVFVYRGSSQRLVASQFVDQAGLGANEAGDRFGAALASGNFVRDRRADLAVGAPGEAPGNDPKSGGVFVYRGTSGNLRPQQFVDQAGLGSNEAGDLFGLAIAD
jgi:hypothetical protein